MPKYDENVDLSATFLHAASRTIICFGNQIFALTIWVLVFTSEILHL